MKKYKIIFEVAYDVIIEAKDEDEAREIFLNGEFGIINEREMTGYDIFPITK